MFLERMIKGFIVGVAFIIPGVSGGTLAIYLGIYQKLLDSIGSIFKDFKNSLRFLVPFGIGGIISVLSLAKVFGMEFICCINVLYWVIARWSERYLSKGECETFPFIILCFWNHCIWFINCYCNIQTITRGE